MVHLRQRVGERAQKKGGGRAASVFLCGDFNGFPGDHDGIVGDCGDGGDSGDGGSGGSRDDCDEYNRNHNSH